MRQMTGQYRSAVSTFAPLGTMFETLALVFSDAVISALMEAKKEGALELKERLTNME
jgi:6-phospho-3-hexuloisomerase